MSGELAGLRVALVHDWLTGMRGGEKVLEAICALVPQSDLFTIVHVPGSVSPAIERRRLRVSALSRLPGIRRYYRYCLPFFPAVVEQFDLDNYDLVISTSHCAAKSIVRPGRARHVCYCHTPMRYVWDQRDAYFGKARVGGARHALARPVLAWLARWDAATAGRVDRYVANSQHVARRIGRYYNRAATVVYPPVDTAFFTPPDDHAPETERAFLVVSALVPYKRLDVAIEASARARAPLRIVGAGPDEPRLRAIAARTSGAAVEFLGARAGEELRTLYRQARAVLMPGEEDFGIVPVEAQACGRPVIALARGGALETVLEGVTGVLVREDDAEAFADAMGRLERMRFDRRMLRINAERFASDRFAREMTACLEEVMAAPKVGATRRDHGRPEGRRHT